MGQRRRVVAVALSVWAWQVGRGAEPAPPNVLTPPPGAISLLTFAQHVVGPGTDVEDWQPAFQAAIALCQQGFRPLHVPAGVYRIRKSIRIVPVEGVKNPSGHQSLRIFGDGRHQSIILQESETENVIDWTGLTYEKPATLGEMIGLCLQGGKTALNIKWHNYFSMDSCYIHGAKEYGVYAEGWSCRFRNSIIRWCFKAGIRGTSHFNNNIVRDCYFSRDGIGFHFTGGYGNRIEGCAFEVCAKAAVFLRGTNSFTINNCYFEGNGYKDQHRELFQVEGAANTLHLDYSCLHINIHDNIFRCNKDPDGAFISAAYTIKGHIYDNTFLNSPTAIKLSDHCETNEGAKPHFGQLIVERNLMKDVETPLAEAASGLIKRALLSGSAFRMRSTPMCEGTPVGTVRPELIGDEVLDTKTRTWYRSVGPGAKDWVPLSR